MTPYTATDAAVQRGINAAMQRMGITPTPRPVALRRTEGRAPRWEIQYSDGKTTTHRAWSQVLKIAAIPETDRINLAMTCKLVAVGKYVRLNGNGNGEVIK